MAYHILRYPNLISTHTLRGERDQHHTHTLLNTDTFQLTRSVGSVTSSFKKYSKFKSISTHTLRGERDEYATDDRLHNFISTHTLRGERDKSGITAKLPNSLFQLTRSVGSVTRNILSCPPYIIISTHTLRGERDSMAMI